MPAQGFLYGASIGAMSGFMSTHFEWMAKTPLAVWMAVCLYAVS